METQIREKDRIINGVSTHISKSKYIRCIGVQREKLFGRTRLAFVRCPKCREYISVYQDEISVTGQTKSKRCLCGFKSSLILKNW